MFLILSLLATANALHFHKTSDTNTFSANVSLYESGNCSFPYTGYSYQFNCPSSQNHTYCCLYEYEKLNTSFGNAKCSQFEMNDTYVTFDCDFLHDNPKGLSKDFYKGVISGVVVLVALLFVIVIIRCITKRNKSYNRI